MKCKKNALSYILWALYFILVSVTLSVTGLKLLETAGITERRFKVLLVCLFFAAVPVLFAILRSLLLYLQRETGEADFLFFVWTERMAVLFLIAVSAAMRIGYVHRYAHTIAGDTTFYDLAKVTEEAAVPWMAHNASYIYTKILAFLFLFTGNHPSAAIYLQAALQVAVMVLFYFIARRMLGRTASVFYLMASACLPQYIQNLNVLSSEVLVCLAAGAGLLAVVLLLDKMAGAEKCGWKYTAAFFGAGLLLAVNGYLDVFGLVVFFAAAAGIFLLDCRVAPSERAFPFAGLFLGFTAGLAVLFGIESLYTWEGFLQAVKTFVRLYTGGVSFSVPAPEAGAALWGSAVLCFLAGLGVVGYCKQDWEKSGIISVMLVGSAFLTCFHINQADYPVLNGILWTLAACAGIQYFADLYFGRCPAASMEPASAARQGEESGTAKPEPEGMKPFPLLPWERDLPQESGRDQAVADPMERVSQEAPQKQEIHYIKNPLPLPKKHVKKELDYGFEPEEDQLEFDLEEEKIKENDGFDIE